MLVQSLIFGNHLYTGNTVTLLAKALYEKNIFQIVYYLAFVVSIQYASATPHPSAKKYADSSATAKLQFPLGFTSTVVFEGLNGARHMAVNKQGGLYVKLSKLKDGKGIV